MASGEEAFGAAEEAFGVTLTEHQKRQFERYVSMLRAWSGRVRLISKSDRERIWEHHILDCLSLVPHLPMNGDVLDLGSGAGLPGIPAAICRPDLNTTLLEPARMKSLFLGEAATQLGLESVTVARDRAERIRSEAPQRFNCVFARAVASLPQLWDWALPLLEPGGQLIAMKGPEPLSEFGRQPPLNATCQVNVFPLPLVGRPRSIVRISTRPSTA